MRVLHVVHWPRSGIGVVVRDLVRHRSPDIRHAVLCLCPGKPTTDQIRRAGADVDEPEGFGLGPLRGLARLRRQIRRVRPDLLHTHSLTPRILSAVGVTGLPQVTTVHTSYRYFQDAGLRNALKRRLECGVSRRVRGGIVCVSRDVANSLPCRSMASRAIVILNGVDVNAVREAARAGEVSSEGDPLLVAVGRLDREKGFDRLLAAVAHIRPEFPGLRLVICGDGSERAVLVERARDLAIDDVVRFTGYLENPMPVLRAADAFVSSSVQEGFPLTAAEAMALGRPVVSTPVSGLSSMLVDGRNVFLASGFGAEEVAGALRRALADEDRLRRIGERGRSFAEARLDVGRMVGEYEGLYHEVLGEKSGNVRVRPSSDDATPRTSGDSR